MSEEYAFTLAVCAEMVFLDRPIEQRVEAIRDLGFAVEIWDWTTKDLRALAATGAHFTSITGYIDGTLPTPTVRTPSSALPRGPLLRRAFSAPPTSTCTGQGWTVPASRCTPSRR